MILVIDLFAGIGYWTQTTKAGEVVVAATAFCTLVATITEKINPQKNLGCCLTHLSLFLTFG
jgi:hypothetical protein